jgi:hypothetical protein
MRGGSSASSSRHRRLSWRASTARPRVCRARPADRCRPRQLTPERVTTRVQRRRPVRNDGGASCGNVFAVKRQEVGAADTQTAPPPTGGARVLVDFVAAGRDLGHHPHGGVGAGANQFGVSVRGALVTRSWASRCRRALVLSVPEPTETNLRSQLTRRVASITAQPRPGKRCDGAGAPPTRWRRVVAGHREPVDRHARARALGRGRR